MFDANRIRMMVVSGVVLLVASVWLSVQFYDDQRDRESKQAACAQKYASLAQLLGGPAPQDGDSPADRGRGEDRQRDPLQVDRIVEAVAACTASAMRTGNRIDAALSIFLRTMGPTVAVLAFVLAGLRYDADRGQLFGGRTARLDFAPDARSNGRRWRISNLGIGAEHLEAFDVMRFPVGGFDRGSLHLGWLVGDRIIGPKEEACFETTFTGDDLLVAARTRGVDGASVVCWARFRRVEGDDRFVKKEEGRLL